MSCWAESPSKRMWCHPHGVCFWEFGQKHAHEDPAGGDVLLIFLAQRSRYQSCYSRVSYNCASSSFPSTLLILCLETRQTFFWQLNYLCSCHRLQVQQVVNIQKRPWIYFYMYSFSIWKKTCQSKKGTLQRKEPKLTVLPSPPYKHLEEY